ncbi:MAG: UDP-N-acetylmuramate--L-alanine ligase [Deltaproteobacteria bacterium]|nr:UDP-N-acetylmuramate--L-alanine ligase [Deltaproteobacteria bacterium]
MYRGRIKKVHFVGIGGSGMSGIAEVLVNMGYKVSGSDLRDSPVTKRLASLGVLIFKGHDKKNVIGQDSVVYSSAVDNDNPELKEARRTQIPVLPRAEMLAELMRLKYGVVVAGTHGKTTTTSMIADVMVRGAMDPTVVTGGRLNSIGANAKLGSGEFLVAEADESDGSFLRLSPTIAVVTNIDREHMDHYSDFEEVKNSFLDFINKVPFYGCAVLCLDHPVIQGLLPSISRRVITYGLSAQSDVSAKNVTYCESETSFDLHSQGVVLGRVTISLPGAHNVANALASIAVGLELGMDFEDIKKGLEGFEGVERRFQVKGKVADVLVVDDYAHHPVEIKAVLTAVKKGWKRRRIAVFQPHRYSRTKDQFGEFLSAFNDADVLIVTGIYSAGERPLEGINAKELCSAIKDHGHRNVVLVEDKDDIPGRLLEITKGGDIVITMGAGDVYRVAERFLEELTKKYPKEKLRVVSKDGAKE